MFTLCISFHLPQFFVFIIFYRHTNAPLAALAVFSAATLACIVLLSE